MGWIVDGEVGNGGYALGGLAVDQLGRLWVAGVGGIALSRDFLIARLKGDGAIDPDFGAGRKVLVDIAGGQDVAKALVLASAVYAKAHVTQGRYERIAVLRYLDR